MTTILLRAKRRVKVNQKKKKKEQNAKLQKLKNKRKSA